MVIVSTKKNSDEVLIKQELLTLLHNKFGIASIKINVSGKGFLSESTIPLNPREMVYFIHLLEDRFSIMLTEANFDDPDIYTINGLVHIIEEHIKQSATT